MLNPDDVGRCVRFGVAVIVLLLAFRYMLRPTLVATFRQRVFALRRELFMLRLEGVILPTDRSYELLMRTLNGVIRFAENFTFGRFLLAFSSRSAPEIQDPLDIAFRQTRARQHLEKIRVRLGYEMVRHVIQSSFLGWLVLFVTAPIFRLCDMLAATPGRFGRLVKIVGARPSVKRMECAASAMLSDDLTRYLTPRPKDRHAHA